MHKSGRFVAALGVLLPALLLLLLPPPAHAQENLIVSIEVTGNEYISRDAILDAVKNILPIASDYAAQKGKDAQTAVMRMGYFADATVSAEVTPDGTKVTIHVVERKRIEKIAFVGNTVVSDSQLTGAILTKVGHVVDNDVIRQDVHRIGSPGPQRVAGVWGPVGRRDFGLPPPRRGVRAVLTPPCGGHRPQDAQGRDMSKEGASVGRHGRTYGCPVDRSSGTACVAADSLQA